MSEIASVSGAFALLKNLFLNSFNMIVFFLGFLELRAKVMAVVFGFSTCR